MESQRQSNPEMMLNHLKNTLTGKDYRKMFGSRVLEDGTHEVFCHPGCFMYCCVEDDTVVQISFMDPIYGAVCLDEAATEDLIEESGLTNGIEVFTFTRKKHDNTQEKTSKKKEAQQEKLRRYQEANLRN